jgi:hypothetical protein
MDWVRGASQTQRLNRRRFEVPFSFGAQAAPLALFMAFFSWNKTSFEHRVPVGLACKN